MRVKHTCACWRRFSQAPAYPWLQLARWEYAVIYHKSLAASKPDIFQIGPSLKRIQWSLRTTFINLLLQNSAPMLILHYNINATFNLFKYGVIKLLLLQVYVQMRLLNQILGDLEGRCVPGSPTGREERDALTLTTRHHSLIIPPLSP